MDAGRYKERKEKGSVKLVRLGPGTFQTVVTHFDPESGDEMEPEVLMVSLDQLEKQVEEIQADMVERQKGLDGLLEMIGDVKTMATEAGDDLDAIRKRKARQGGMRPR